MFGDNYIVSSKYLNVFVVSIGGRHNNMDKMVITTMLIIASER
jgi:hypothetical protein